ncbi:MAG: squalene--hopene cyclase [Planctomycetes bacterium]|nr:squalene--hopene cyclase [Planctomycetota bacterium]
MTSTDLENTLHAARDHLLAARTDAGHWEGHLSSSALSTATAAWALHVVERDRGPGPFSALIQPGLDWLTRHQNHDGGWGDTVLSASNLSTSLLAWSALAASDGRDAHRRAVGRAEAYLARVAGGLTPEHLADAVVAAYGRDRTFSAPILMMAAQAGRLGPGREAWRHVRALPFELAALPPSWWKRLRLPVVSYALPALVAVGQARFRQAPPRCPLCRLVRRAAVGPTLRRLETLQPAGGGFLEATPLTSFVAMALAAAGQAHGDVAGRCIDFLARSVRDDGSWPIDTNLATWVTTLAVGALESRSSRMRKHAETSGVPQDACGAIRTSPAASAAGSNGALSADDRRRIADWLLDQQHRGVHPYTQADPGGWAWTDLSGGVPDADDTAGAVLALARLAPDDDRAAVPSEAGTETRRAASGRIAAAAAEGVRWLLGLQNRDGGIPTFCRGWGNLPFDRSSPDLTAHAVAAWSAWRDRLPAPLADRARRATERALAYLARVQRSDGAWLPLWFGSEHVADQANPTYGTARVVAALADLSVLAPSGGAVVRSLSRAQSRGNHRASRVQATCAAWQVRRPAARPSEVAAMAERGVRWLLAAQDASGGWGGDAGAPPSVEETALATEALAAWGASCRAAGICEQVRLSSRGREPAGTFERQRAPTAIERTRDLTVAARETADEAREAARRGAAYLVGRTRGGTAFEPAPIGFYFASLWYFERLYPVIFTVSALGRVRALLAVPQA